MTRDWIYISLRQFAPQKERYNRFRRQLKRTTVLAGEVTFEGVKRKYRKTNTNTWYIRIKRDPEEVAKNNAKHRAGQKAYREGKRRPCCCCEKNIPVGKKGKFCSDSCKKIHEDYAKLKENAFGGAIPEFMTSSRTIGRPKYDGTGI